MNVSLRKFLQTGYLGQLHLGMSAQDILDLIGRPDTGSLASNGESTQSGSYGNFDFSFWNLSPSASGLSNIKWNALEGNARLPAAWILEDWGITADMQPVEVKTYLKDNGLPFQKRSSKGYHERKPVTPRMSPEMALAAQEMGLLVFRKPKREADILRETGFTKFILKSGVEIHFVDEKLIWIMICNEI